MIIELMRAHTTDEIGREEACEICADAFRTEHVLAHVSTEAGTLEGLACTNCVHLLGTYRPEKFPTIEEFDAARWRFQGPIWDTAEEASAAEEQGASYDATLEANRIVRAGGC